MNYRPWFALAEFVDNAVQSYLEDEDKLRALDPAYRLAVSIDFDTSARQITIRDNAGGIKFAQYARAFRPAAAPPDTSGLCEFGMGMKSAACWFSPQWRVRTSALGETKERLVSFDIKKIVQDKIDELNVEETDIAPGSHFTEIRLSAVDKMPQGPAIGKIRNHLRGIYRDFLRQATLELKVGGEILTFTDPKILNAPYYADPDGTPKYWRKDIEFDLGEGYRVTGFAALREKMSLEEAGFVLLRRNRVIQGSGDNRYRPKEIFGGENSHRYQRLFGELHLEGFEVSHTKDGFTWVDLEDLFLECLKEELTKDKELLILRQAEEYRVKSRNEEILPKLKEASEGTAQSLQAAPAKDSEPHHSTTPPSTAAAATTSDTTDQTAQLQQPVSDLIYDREIAVDYLGYQWKISLEFVNDEAVSDWLNVRSEPPAADRTRTVGVTVAVSHPFMQRFANLDANTLEPFIRMAVALGVAEVAARDAGVGQAGAIRKNLNDLLRTCLSRPSA